jgi:hypothetical protein
MDRVTPVLCGAESKDPEDAYLVDVVWSFSTTQAENRILPAVRKVFGPGKNRGGSTKVGASVVERVQTVWVG